MIHQGTNGTFLERNCIFFYLSTIFPVNAIAFLVKQIVIENQVQLLKYTKHLLEQKVINIAGKGIVELQMDSEPFD